ncbi:MAG: large subunit ribosomal protein L4 [Cellvibrionaceae bacterium]|jgi:large subunit ribosomal protein L4
MQVSIVNMTGKVVGETELPAGIFQAKVNRGLMHQALVRQMNAARQGTQKAKTRGEVNRSNRKIYKQKGTGNARHGSRKAPIFVGGGIAHAVVPRDHTKKMPTKMLRAALRSALTVKAANGDILVVDDVALDAPKTKDMKNFVGAVAGDNSTLLVIPTNDFAVERSARNLADVKALNAMYLNIRDLLGFEKVLLSVKSLDVISTWLSTDKIADGTGYDPSEYAEDESEAKARSEIKALKLKAQQDTEAVRAEANAEAKSAAEDTKAMAEDARADEVAETSNADPDDLKKIEGIGPKIALTLANENITTFAQLAALSVDQIKEMLQGKVRIAHPDTWPEQAALAADGKWDALEKLQEELQGGRRN